MRSIAIACREAALQDSQRCCSSLWLSTMLFRMRPLQTQREVKIADFLESLELCCGQEIIRGRQVGDGMGGGRNGRFGGAPILAKTLKNTVFCVVFP